LAPPSVQASGEAPLTLRVPAVVALRYTRSLAVLTVPLTVEG
jgi:hypothetical protein